MMHSNLSLQKAVYETLSTSDEVKQLLGGVKIYDDVPANAPFPYVTFGHSQAYDWCTGTEDGHEHILTLHVWSRRGGRELNHQILSALEEAMNDVPSDLGDDHLVNLRMEFADARRDPDGETIHGLVRYRVKTETLN